MESQAASLGIPMQISIGDDIRHADCDAHMADLVSIESNGRIAVYKGECNMRHNYETRLEVEELQQKNSIVNGELTIGGQKGYEAEDLEEY